MVCGGSEQGSLLALHEKLVDLLALVLLDLAALLAEHCLLLSDLEQQLGQLPLLLQVLGQPRVLVLQPLTLQRHRPAQRLGRHVQHPGRGQLAGRAEVLLGGEGGDVLRGVEEEGVFVVVGGVDEVEVCAEAVDLLRGRGVTPCTTERWWRTREQFSVLREARNSFSSKSESSSSSSWTNLPSWLRLPLAIWKQNSSSFLRSAFWRRFLSMSSFWWQLRARSRQSFRFSSIPRCDRDSGCARSRYLRLGRRFLNVDDMIIRDQSLLALLALLALLVLGVLLGEGGLCLPTLGGGDLGEVEDAEGGDVGDDEEAVVGEFGDQVVGEDEALEAAAGGELGDFLEFGDLVVHEEEVLEVGEGVVEVGRDAADAVVGGHHRRQPVQVREVPQLPQLIVREVDALEEVLSRVRGTRVAPMFSMAVSLYPRRSSCRSFSGFVNCGECWISSAVIFILLYNIATTHPPTPTLTPLYSPAPTSSYSLLPSPPAPSCSLLLRRRKAQLLAMFKRLTRSLGVMVMRPVFGCSQGKPEALAVAQQELFSQYHSLKGWKTVRLLHAVTVGAGGGLAKREEEEQVGAVLESLRAEMHLLPQREVNMLLEVLRDRGLRYQRTDPLFRALNKHANLFFGRQYRASELTRSLQLYRQLGFPRATWVKMVGGFLDIGEERAKKDEQLRLSVGQLLKLAILIVEEPCLPLQHVKTLLQRVVAHNANTLDTLAALYHLARILPNALRANVNYQLARSSAKDLLFNPYAQMEQDHEKEKEKPEKAEEEKGEEEKGEEEGAAEQEERVALQTKLNESVGEILKLFFGAVDVGKLQAAIVKSVEAEMEPVTKENLLFACDIPALGPAILAFLRAHLHELTPVEFLHLLRRAPKEAASSLLGEYEQKLGKFMNLRERAYFTLETHRFFHVPVTAEAVLSMLQAAESVDYQEFVAVTRLVEQLPKHAHSRVPEILAAIKAKTKP